jgi:hypothetical protein
MVTIHRTADPSARDCNGSITVALPHCDIDAEDLVSWQQALVAVSKS